MRNDFAALIFISLSAYCQPAGSWKDPSPHQARLMNVQGDVRLEVLDWGGSGKPIVLLAGLGNTAHVFDDFAPKLTNDYHVYGITRRGFGASAYSGSEFGSDRLGDDVLAVMDELKLEKPVLIGHSLGGLELSSVATRYAGRVAGLIYLDAAYWYAFDNGNVPAKTEYRTGGPPQPPAPTEADRANFSSFTRASASLNGFAFPEAELRQLWDSTPHGQVGKRRSPPGGLASAMADAKKYAVIPVPALAIFAVPHSQPAWIRASSDPALKKAADASNEVLDRIAERQAKAVEEGVPTARVVRVENANHMVFLSNEAEVLREVRAFLKRF